MGQLFGLPAHPLLVHAPVVIVPLVAIAAVVAAARPTRARRHRWTLVGGVALGFVLLLGARQSGQELENAFAGVVDVDTHAALANATTLLALVWLVATVAGALLLQRGSPRARSVGAAGADGSVATAERVVLVAAAVLAVVTTIWLIRTGHEGAYSHWKPVTDQYFD